MKIISGVMTAVIVVLTFLLVISARKNDELSMRYEQLWDRWFQNEQVNSKLKVDYNERSHWDDYKNGNAYYVQELDGDELLNFYGRMFMIRDKLGYRIVTEYDVLFIMSNNKLDPVDSSLLLSGGIKCNSENAQIIMRHFPFR